MNRYQKVLFASALALSVGGASMSAIAHPTARIAMEIKQGGFVIGGTSGSGYVRYHRRNYPIAIGGIRFGAIVGASHAKLQGKVSNLRSLADVEGTYTSSGASGALGAGKNWIKLKNANGVHLDLYGVQEGVELSLDVGGITISLSR